VRRELQGILRDEINDARLQSTRVTHVVLSVDYRHARVHYAIITSAGTVSTGDRRAVQTAFTRAGPFLRRRLADAIDLKRVPDLSFVLDGEMAE
jgi:ribosome-binding factor A